MIHEETTTEIQIPGYQSKKAAKVVPFPTEKKASPPPVPKSASTEMKWALRLIAVVTVLLLSLLII